LSEDELAYFIAANLHAAIAVGWEESDAELVTSAHVMAFLLWALDAGGEWKLADDSVLTNITATEKVML